MNAHIITFSPRSLIVFFLTVLSTLYQNNTQNVYCDETNTANDDLQKITDVLRNEQCVLKETMRVLRCSCWNHDLIEKSFRDLTENISQNIDDATAMLQEHTEQRNADVAKLQKSMNQMHEEKMKVLNQFQRKVLDKMSSISSTLVYSARILNVIKSDDILVRDCWDIYKSGKNETGIYRLWPKGWKNIGSFYAFCDMEGGWTVLYRQKAEAEKMYFSRSWMDYNIGFGELKENFWIGNDKMCCLSNQREYVLHFTMWNHQNQSSFARYKLFLVSQRHQFYKLQIGDYRGTAGDILGASDNAAFSTKDKDHDNSTENCADHFNIGWWYAGCTTSDTFRFRLSKNFTNFEMKIRPLDVSP